MECYFNRFLLGACLSWTLNNITDAHAAIADWKIYMCRQTDWLEPSVTWERVGDVIRHKPSSMSYCIVVNYATPLCDCT